MSYKHGDKVMWQGKEYRVECAGTINIDGSSVAAVEICLDDNSGWCWVAEWRLQKPSPAAPPKLGKVRVIGYPDGSVGTWHETSCSYEELQFTATANLRFDRIIDLDALTADRERAENAERRVAELEAANDAQDTDIRGYRVATHYLEEDLKRERAELDRLRASRDGDLVPLDELWQKHGIYISYSRDKAIHQWIFRDREDDRMWEMGAFPTHAAAHAAASAWAKKQEAK